MAAITITQVEVLDNPTKFLNPFQFEITFSAVAPLDEDLEWKVTYVGSYEDDSYDQELDSILVGPIPAGQNRFLFQTNPVDPSRIPHSELLGVTVVLLSCSYRNQEFIRVGYYVYNYYEDKVLNENPPETHDYSMIMRDVYAKKPRLTYFPISWENEQESLGEMNDLRTEMEGIEMEAKPALSEPSHPHSSLPNGVSLGQLLEE
eukprot:GCRY01003605.1.p1 GENE.GCRY01003605.1~~GCRY01003605.1.p1  ORF type:complete len:204 (-),score=33.14 GCRY01003605.1:569-1180(-)